MANFRKFLEKTQYLMNTLYLAVIGCTKNHQPIEVTVHSHCVESFEGLLQRCRRGRGCSELSKNTIFPEHPVQAVPYLLPNRFIQIKLFNIKKIPCMKYLNGISMGFAHGPYLKSSFVALRKPLTDL